MLQQGSGGRVVRLLRASLELVLHPGSWPFGVVRGRGDWSAAMIFMALGMLVTHMLQQVLVALLVAPGTSQFWISALLAALLWTISWSLTTLLLARELDLGTAARDELAGALAVGWVPVIFVVTLLGTLLERLLSTLALSGFGLSGVALVLGLMLVSQKAVRTLFRAPFEESFRPVALALLFNAFVQGLIMYFLGKLYAG